MKKLIGFSLIWIIIDFILKYIIVNNISLDEIINVTNFFNITYVKNIGASFSIFEGGRIPLIVIALIALNIIYCFYKKEEKTRLKDLTYSLLVGGIIGNLIDRVLYGYVIDYIGVIIFGYHFPIFNFADSCIVIGCLLMIFIVIKEELRCKNIK